MIVLSLKTVDFSTRFTSTDPLPAVSPTVVVDEEAPSMALARQTESYYAKCFALPEKVDGATIHRRITMSSAGVIQVIDDIRHPHWRAHATYCEKTA